MSPSAVERFIVFLLVGALVTALMGLPLDGLLLYFGLFQAVAYFAGWLDADLTELEKD